MADKIEVEIDENGNVNKDKVRIILKEGQDQLVWVSKASKTYHIGFTEDCGSPWGRSDRHFQVGKNGRCNPGPITKQTAEIGDNEEKTFTYGIGDTPGEAEEAANACACGVGPDPTIIVQN